MKKYLCIGIDKVPAEWLPRWYGVPFEECCFVSNVPDKHIRDDVIKYTSLIKLRVIPNGCYKQHLKILKTERLLNE
jgi:hypothetical protein